MRCAASGASSGTYRDAVTEDDFNAFAWREFILWAWNEPEMRAQFAKKTGLTFQRQRTSIEAIIDAATGSRKDVAFKFVEWATREHWGIESAPAAYQKALANKAPRQP